MRLFPASRKVRTLALAGALLAAGTAAAEALTLVVYTNNDAGPGSLRQALTDANRLGGTNRVVIDVGGDITLTQPLPKVRGHLTIDGGKHNPVLRTGALAPAFVVTAEAGKGGSLTLQHLAIARQAAEGGKSAWREAVSLDAPSVLKLVDVDVPVAGGEGAAATERLTAILGADGKPMADLPQAAARPPEGFTPDNVKPLPANDRNEKQPPAIVVDKPAPPAATVAATEAFKPVASAPAAAQLAIAPVAPPPPASAPALPGPPAPSDAAAEATRLNQTTSNAATAAAAVSPDAIAGNLNAVSGSLGGDGAPAAGGVAAGGAPMPGAAQPPAKTSRKNSLAVGLAISGALLKRGAQEFAGGVSEDKKAPDQKPKTVKADEPSFVTRWIDAITHLDDTQRMIFGALVALIAIATVIAVGMPYLATDPLDKRMKSVASERERIRTRERERLAATQSKVNLRREPKAYMKNIVDQFNLSKWLGTEKAKMQMTMAGYRGAHTEVAFLFFRLVTPVVFFLAALFYIFVMSDFDWPVMLKLAIAMGAAYIGLKAPEIFLSNQIKKRQFSMGRAFPDAMDLLLICVESGVSIEQAARRVAQEIGVQSVPLAEEFSLTTAELSFLPDRKTAYENFAARTGLDSVKQVTTVLIQAERYGTPLGSALRVLAQESRDHRLMEAEKKAAALPPKLTVPMIIFFLPVLFAVIMTPAIIQISGAGLAK